MAESPPLGLRWRSSRIFIIATVTIGLFTDTFLYCLVIPVMPFLLRDRLGFPDDIIQSKTDVFLAAFAIASVLFSVPAGWLSDWTTTRRGPYLSGLIMLIASTLLFAVAQTFWLMVLSRFLQGMSAAIVNATSYAMLIDLVGSESLGATIGTTSSFIGVAWLGSAPIGGVLYAVAGYAGVFGISLAILIIDFVMRILVIEQTKPTTAPETLGEGQDHPSAPVTPADATESDALLPTKSDQMSGGKMSLLEAVPILRCMGDIRMLAALFSMLTIALTFGTFDATLTTEAMDLFDFTSLEAGLLFFALSGPYFLVSPFAGRAVDRYGPRIVAVVGYGLSLPCIALLCLPEMLNRALPREQNIALICVLLAMNGICCSISNAPGIIEATLVLDECVAADPSAFGKKGPYGQLFGLSWLITNVGLTVGPLLGGWLRETIGYGGMNALLGSLSGAAALTSFFYMGRKNKTQDI